MDQLINRTVLKNKIINWTQIEPKGKSHSFLSCDQVRKRREVNARHRRDSSVTVVIPLSPSWFISSYRCSSDSEVPISFIFIKISSQFHMLFICCAQGSGFSIHNQNFIWICWCMIDLYGFHLKIHMGQNFTMFLFGLLCFSLSLFNKHCLVWL